MKPRIVFLVLIAFVFLFSQGEGVSASLTQTCSDKLSWLEDSADLVISQLKINNNSNILLGNFDSSTDSFSDPNGRAIISRNTNLDFVKEGAGSLNFTYNTTGTGLWSSARKYPINYNLTNYTGIATWVYGDNSNNTLFIQVGTNFTGTTQDNEPIGASRLTLNFTGWRYYYQDFGYLKNKTTEGVSLNRNETEFVYLIRVFVTTDDYLVNFSTIYLDNVEFIDFDKGNLNRQIVSLNDIGPDGRYQESMYNLIYLYNYGLPPYLNNETLLNYTLMMGDWLSRHQLPSGGWQENDIQFTSTSANTGFPGVTFMKSLILLKESSRMQDNVTTYRLGNITTKTRGELWNETAELMANYTLGFTFPTYWVSNQYYSHLHASYLYMNYSGKFNTYNSSINNQLITMNNTQQINSFGFNPEQNTTSLINGFDTGYYGVGKVSASSFYQDYNNNILANIINKLANSSLNVISDGSMNINNASRGNDFYLGVYDSQYGKTVSGLNNIYGKQEHYLATNRNSIIGTSTNPTERYRGADFYVGSYSYCSFVPLNQSFKFPISYSYYSYDLMNYTKWNSRTINNQGNITNRGTYNFPLMLFAYDDNSSWWIRGDYILSNGTWIYSDSNGNFTLPIIPRAYVSETGTDYWTTSDGDQVTETTKISFTSSSPTQKIITSNLVDNINADVVAQFPNCDGSRFNYNGQIISSGFTCSGDGVFTFSQLQVNSGENTLEQTQVCVYGETIGYTIIMIFTSLGILAICFLLLNGNLDIKNPSFDRMNMKTLLLVFFLIIIGVAFISAMGNTIAARCTI